MARSDTSPLRRTFPVPGGPPVRLRMAGPSDRPLVAGLLERRGRAAAKLDRPRPRAVDPARRPRPSAARRPGRGARAARPGAAGRAAWGRCPGGADAPDVLVVDERFGPALADVLGRVLLERARPRRRAA